MDEIQVQLPTQSRCPESLRLQHSWQVDVQNQQNHIAHEAVFQRAGNSTNGIDYDGKKDTDL